MNSTDRPYARGSPSHSTKTNPQGRINRNSISESDLRGSNARLGLRKDRITAVATASWSVNILMIGG